MLSSYKFEKIKNLGDFVVFFARYDFDVAKRNYFLTEELVENTEREVNDLLRILLQDVTGEKDLTWSLVDALDIMVVLGNQYYTKCMKKIIRQMHDYVEFVKYFSSKITLRSFVDFSFFICELP